MTAPPATAPGPKAPDPTDMRAITLAESVLVLIDYQERLMPSIDQAESVLAKGLRLADIARELSVPVIGTEQNPAGLGPSVEAVRQRCDRTLIKQNFDACADGLLETLAQLRGDKATLDIVIAGCEAHVCLLQTSLGLLRAGYRVWVVAQACGSRRRTDHALAMQRLLYAGAKLVSIEMVAFEWLQDSANPRFRQVLKLIKLDPPGDSNR